MDIDYDSIEALEVPESLDYDTDLLALAGQAEEKVKSSVYPDLNRSPGKNDNWVEAAGGLPRYIERIAKHLHYERGMTISHAIATAVNRVKKWASGVGNVNPDTRAKAAAAVAEWEAKKAKSKAKTTARAAAKDSTKTLDANDGSTETKDAFVGDEMVDAEFTGIEYKNVGVRGLRVADPETGVVEAIVSVTGIVDEVKDIIKPGAYAKTLAKRTPKGVYSHSWDQPISKTLDIKELMPGDKNLPKTLANGDPWPKEAGALWVKMQFNLDTDRGRNAFSDVKFFGDDQEWSIGYNVPVGAAKVNTKTGQREIDYLDLFEYSPVLFGAMPLAATQSVKTAQAAFKAMQGQWSGFGEDEAVEEVLDEEKTIEDAVEEKSVATADAPATDTGSEIIDPVTAEDIPDVDAGIEDPTTDDNPIETYVVTDDDIVSIDLWEDEDFADAEEYEPVAPEAAAIKAILGPDDMDVMVKAMTALNDLLGTVTGYKAHQQVPGEDNLGTPSPADDGDGSDAETVADAVEEAFPDDEEMVKAAGELDAALGTGDEEKIDAAANDFLDIIETRMDDSTDDTEQQSLTDIAQTVADLIDAATTGKEPPSEGTTQEKALDSEQGEDASFEEVDLSGLAELKALLDG